MENAVCVSEVDTMQPNAYSHALDHLLPLLRLIAQYPVWGVCTLEHFLTLIEGPEIKDFSKPPKAQKVNAGRCYQHHNPPQKLTGEDLHPSQRPVCR